uniref:Protein kinase domain-containing protein n=1 Tax=Panagrolaimus sp. ES5 TaxID=591445 RepID=A0AC34F0I7_9BILA
MKKLSKPTVSDFNSLEKTKNNSKFLQISEKFQVKQTAQFFISESPKLGTLADYVKLNGPLNEITIRSIMNQLLEAADFLQRNQLAHLCFDIENIFVETSSSTNDNNNSDAIVVKVSPFGLVQHECKFCCEEKCETKASDDTIYTTDYCKHIRDLSLSLLTIMLGLLRGQKRKEALITASEVASDEYRRETEALANELMLKAFCGNVEYSVDSASGAHWPLPRLPSIGQRVSRVTEYGRFIYEINGKAIFEYTNGTNLVQGICEVLKISDKQKVRLYKPIKPCPLPTSSEELVKKHEIFEKEFDSIKKLDSTAICLYHMICNDVEAFLSHTPAWILRSPFALPRIVGVIMHNGDVHLTFGDTVDNSIEIAEAKITT